MILGIDTIVIDLEDAKKLYEVMTIDGSVNREFYKKLEKKGLFTAFSNF